MIQKTITDETWSQVQADYEGSLRSIREIARTCGISEGSIRVKVKQLKWKRPKKKSLTTKEIRKQKIFESLLQGKTKAQAMRDAGYAESTATSKQTAIVGEVQEELVTVLKRKGVTIERLADVLDRGLDATKVISANIIAKSGEGMADAHSMTKDFIDVPDFAVQHKFMESGYKLHGHLNGKDDGGKGGDGPSAIHLTFRRDEIGVPIDKT